MVLNKEICIPRQYDLARMIYYPNTDTVNLEIKNWDVPVQHKTKMT